MQKQGKRLKDYHDMTNAEFERFIENATSAQLTEAILQHIDTNPFVCHANHQGGR